MDSLDRFRLTPENTVVASSTPEVFDLYLELGYQVIPVELTDRKRKTFNPDPPWRVMDKWIAAGLKGEDWRTQEDFVCQVARASQRLYRKYGLGDQILELHRSPLLTVDGDLTETRDYNTYVRAFDEGATRKYELVKEIVRPGRIVDIGCCTGSLIRELTLDPKFRESDFYGIEIARPLYAECLHRKEQGAFGSENVFFYQQDIASRQIFAEHTVDTFTTFSLTHEIESYSGRPALLRFLSLIRQQLALGGCWINVDVVGPEVHEQTVLLKLNREDGRNDDFEREVAGRAELKAYLDGLSTYGRFMRFARDFRREEGYRLQYELIEIEGMPLIRLRLQDACEFLSKKDYTDNWTSEMHEAFCFWSFSEWQAAIEQAGMRVSRSSYAFTNPWIVEQRYRGKVELWRETEEGLKEMPYPVTNMLLVAEA